MSEAAPSLLVWLVLLLGGFGFSALLVLAAIRYSTGRGLLDEPGRRRSHTTPTARGGGVGIVVAYLAALKLLALLGFVPVLLAATVALALLAVAAIGWLDDHRPQPALRRLAVHAASACLLVATILPLPRDPADGLVAAVAVLLLMTAINFSNFMDGSNGLLALQAMGVASVLMLLAAFAASWPAALLAGLLVASTAGFLPFNFPQARIFLGDVGSGALGLLIGVLGLTLVRSGDVSVWLLLTLTSALWVDAGLTLVWRMLAGRRWYQAHREHLYQWLIRSGWSHAAVAWLYLAWTLMVATPFVLLATAGWLPELAALVAVAALGSLVWLVSRQALLRQAATP